MAWIVCGAVIGGGTLYALLGMARRVNDDRWTQRGWWE